ncbi:MAG: type I-U CRISPR-associated protein Cas7, partial [Planctomycetaceae bacterium]|nr:type I-U CRISPR-associated protein Cas7 [Planctomycetaceae bacterium]
CSEWQEKFHEAFQAVLKGNCEPLAKLAPTSLVFGVWDSRDTQAKLPRLLSSTIRAFNVKPLHRSAQFVPAIEYVDNELLAEPSDKKTRDAYAERGFIHVPASWSHGGVIASGGIRRDATLSLAALRLLSAGSDADKTRGVQRYILGLALTAFTFTPAGYLRQGCNLVPDPDNPREFLEVHADGQRVPADVSHQVALDFAQEAAKAFGVGESKTVPFDKERAKKDAAGKEKKATKKTAKKR